MSDDLLVEFYEDRGSRHPISVFSRHGGSNPEEVAETLADFFLEMGSMSYVNWSDAGALASRFILKQQQMHYGGSELELLSAFPVSKRPLVVSQVVKVWGGERPSVGFDADGITHSDEVAVARYILGRVSIDVDCGSHVGPRTQVSKARPGAPIP